MVGAVPPPRERQKEAKTCLPHSPPEEKSGQGTGQGGGLSGFSHSYGKVTSCSVQLTPQGIWGDLTA